MTEFEWPWEYGFPPFFTLQAHQTTRQLQLSTWCDLVLAYQKHCGQSVINILEDNPVFMNATINRKLNTEAKAVVLQELQKNGHADLIDKKKRIYEVYWHTLTEWGTIIRDYVDKNGLTNTVCTIYELVAGDNTVDQPFYGLDEAILIKALRMLEESQQCVLMEGDDGAVAGVKFL